MGVRILIESAARMAASLDDFPGRQVRPRDENAVSFDPARAA